MAFVLKSQSSPLYILFPSGRLDLGNELESITDCSGLEKKMGLFAVLINKKYTKDGLELSFFIVARCTYPLDIKMQFKFGKVFCNHQSIVCLICKFFSSYEGR